MAMKLTLLALTACLPTATTAETVLGVYIFHRHGDRTSKSFPPANLTSLGAEQVYASGGWFRDRYVSANASSPIYGLSHDIVVNSQLAVTAPVDVVLQSSAQGFLQGLYPPAGTLSTQELANGSSYEPPFSGYQYIPVNGVSGAASSSGSEDSTWLQAGSGCENAVASSNNYLTSPQYLSTFNRTQGFYQGLLPVINTTFSASQANFKNGYTIFDYVNVGTIHNATIPSGDLLTNQTLEELLWFANEHEFGLAYNASDPIRAVSGSVLAAQILQQLNATLTGKSKQPVGIQFGAYAAFLSFFGLAQLPAVSDDFTGIVDYASSITFELVTNTTGVSSSSYPSPSDVSVRFLFTNHSAAQVEPVAYPLFGLNETLLPWDTFADEMGKFAIGDTESWCAACGNSTGVCAGTSSGSGGGDSGTATQGSTSGNNISLPVAGVIGALVTLVVILGLEALVYFIAGLRLVKKSTLAGASAAGGSAATDVTGSKA